MWTYGHNSTVLYISMLATYVLCIVSISIMVEIFLLPLHSLLQIIYDGLWNLLLINVNFCCSPLSLLYKGEPQKNFHTWGRIFFNDLIGGTNYLWLP